MIIAQGYPIFEVLFFAVLPWLTGLGKWILQMDIRQIQTTPSMPMMRAASGNRARYA
jgi:hypothetical protein